MWFLAIFTLQFKINSTHLEVMYVLMVIICIPYLFFVFVSENGTYAYLVYSILGFSYNRPSFIIMYLSLSSRSYVFKHIFHVTCN